MFKVLESSGLHGFLGFSSAIFETSFVEFFQNASVRDDKVVSSIQGKAVEISRRKSEIETGEPNLEEPMVTETTETTAVETESRIDVSSITNYDEEEPVVGTEKEKEEEKEKDKEKMCDARTQRGHENRDK
ncbi:hypothetical protein F511_14603 [Dorcoceras hygrometricum]|uniref:Uncharacterized protein n=1 Tax=Dorcoceras hygrometricum TaxID=472368 RepID=A0A2Z7CGM1_9LAMI|nr:hypothetical protein F511_14603 [Dorcoceras hygrometricum]